MKSVFYPLSLFVLSLFFAVLSCNNKKPKNSENTTPIQEVEAVQNQPPSIIIKPAIEPIVSKSKMYCDDPAVSYEAKEDINFELHPSILIKNNCPTQTIATLRCLLKYSNDPNNGFVKVFKKLNISPLKSIIIPINIPGIDNVEMMDYYTSDGEYHSTYAYEKKKMIKIQEGLKKQYPDLKFQ